MFPHDRILPFSTNPKDRSVTARQDVIDIYIPRGIFGLSDVSLSCYRHFPTFVPVPAVIRSVIDETARKVPTISGLKQPTSSLHIVPATKTRTIYPTFHLGRLNKIVISR
jgi:hypothetical protein